MVTNQAGIAKGLYTVPDMRALHRHMAWELEARGVHVDGWYFCPHHPGFTGPCSCRKPAPGMLLRAMRDFRAEPAGCVMYGDKESDESAAKAAAVEFHFAANGRLDSLEVGQGKSHCLRGTVYHFRGACR